MTAPRQVLPGTTYLVTRRCLERRFFLKPVAATTAAFSYLLAVLASRHGIRLHAYCVLSNHFHIVLTDHTAALPRFMQELNATLARFVNALHGRKETVFAPGSYNAVALADEGAVLEKCAYTIANPVAAGLVEHAREWPGARSAPEHIGGPGVVFERPKDFFDADGGMPDQETLRLEPPPGQEVGAFRTALEGRVAQLERDAGAALKAEGRSFLGVRRVLAQRVDDRAVSEEEPRRRIPHVMAIDERLKAEALARLQAFREAYRDALERLREGVRSVLFPPGTYLLRVHLNVRCAAAT